MEISFRSKISLIVWVTKIEERRAVVEFFAYLIVVRHLQAIKISNNVLDSQH